MELFTPEQYNQLMMNGNPVNRDQDHAPVAMLTLPGTSMVWLISELDPEDTTLAFGLCDLGMGCPELGYVSLKELCSIKHPVFGTTVYNNPLFKANYPMSAYAAAARAKQEIVWNETIVARYAGSTKPGGLKP